MSIEREKFPLRRVIAPLLALSIGIVGCSIDSSPSDTTSPVKVNKTHESTNNVEDIIIDTTYTTTGKRITRYTYSTPIPDISLADVLSYCDGHDLIDQTGAISGDAGSSVARTVNHPACADGKLTPSDFAVPKK